MGEATAPNVEMMIDKGAELVIVSPFQNSGYGPVEKLGIPIIEGADYMESLPLGRTEWIRFYGMLFGKEALADSIFRQTEKSYLDLKQLVTADMPRPTVISEKKFGASWFMPAGDSYIANMYADAGADYVFKELPGAGSTPLAFETVLDRAIHADMWLIKYNQSEDMPTVTCVPNTRRTRTSMPLRTAGFIPAIRDLSLIMRNFLCIPITC